MSRFTLHGFALRIVSSALVATIAFGFTTLSTGAWSSTPGCMVCTPNGCNLSPGEWITRTGTTWVNTCIDFDHDGLGHCCMTERQQEEMYAPDPVYPQNADDIGFCYKMVCNAATPSDVACSHPYPIPTSNAALFRPATAIVPTAAPTTGCFKDAR